MGVFMAGVRCAVALAVAVTTAGVCHASGIAGYCPFTVCGSNSTGVVVTYPFRLFADVAADKCYTNYTTLLFQCINQSLYLNFTTPIESLQYAYRVAKINYKSQILELESTGQTLCRPFNLANFAPLNMSANSSLLLDCKTAVNRNCLPNPIHPSTCTDYPPSLNGVAPPRYSCLFTLADYQNPLYRSSCRLFQQAPQVIQTHPGSSHYLQLQWQGNTSAVPSGISYTPAPSPSPRSHKNVIIIVAGVLMGFLVVAIIFLLITLCWCRWSRGKSGESSKFEDDKKAFAKIRSSGSGHATQLFSYKELEHATQGFSTKQELGGGGFGTVYRGKLGDGRLVAVKKLNQGGSQGIQQFLNEVEVLSKVRHPHLVELLGCCMERPLLVYEFVPNGSISNHLHGGYEGAFPWETRLEVAIQTAEALAYLHFYMDPPIFHRDVKTTNILLDKDFKVKIADFGLSRLVPNMEVTHISTAPQGTPGYLDPDYHESYHLSDKSDVYSFGVVLMELVTAKKAVDMARERKEINLASLAVAKIHSGCLHEILDPYLKRVFPVQPGVQVMVGQVAELAFRCLASEKDDRPSMKEVLAELQRIQRVGYGELPSPRKSDSEHAPDCTKDPKTLLKPDALWPPPSPTSVQDAWVSHTTSPADSLAEMA